MPEPDDHYIDTTTAALLSAAFTGAAAVLRWYLHPGYGAGLADFILVVLLFFLLLSVISGAFGPGIIEWSRRHGRFRVIVRDDSWEFYTHYTLTLIAMVAAAIVFLWLPKIK
jgi:hypothetical protein